MKVDSLVLNRAASYEPNAGQLYGAVCLKGDAGEIKVNLSPGSISRLLQAIESEVVLNSKFLAKRVPAALEDTISGALLLENNGTIAVEVL